VERSTRGSSLRTPTNHYHHRLPTNPHLLSNGSALSSRLLSALHLPHRDLQRNLGLFRLQPSRRGQWSTLENHDDMHTHPPFQSNRAHVPSLISAGRKKRRQWRTRLVLAFHDLYHAIEIVSRWIGLVISSPCLSSKVNVL